MTFKKQKTVEILDKELSIVNDIKNDNLNHLNSRGFTVQND